MLVFNQFIMNRLIEDGEAVASASGTSTADLAQGPGGKIGPVLKRKKKKLNNFKKTLLKIKETDK